MIETVSETSSASRTIRVLAVAALVGLLAALTLNRFDSGDEDQGAPALPNPLFSEFQRVASGQDLDLEFARAVRWQDRTPEADRHPIFESEAGSWDVIIFGDSIVSYGVIPQVVSQASGLRVATFAVPATGITPGNAEVYAAIAERYLSPGGRVLLMFSVWTQMKVVNEGVNGRLAALDDSFFRALDRGGEGQRLAYRAYVERRRGWDQALRSGLGLQLPSLPLYERWIEPEINPEWHAAKRALREGALGERFAWDGWTATLYSREPEEFSRYSRAPAADPHSVLDEVVRSRAATRARAALSLPGEKIYVIPWYASDDVYVAARTLYQAFYSDGTTLLDLGLLHETDARHPSAGRAHFTNESGLVASLRIGRWLKANAGKAIGRPSS
jgi:hypothetical protein